MATYKLVTREESMVFFCANFCQRSADAVLFWGSVCELQNRSIVSHDTLVFLNEY